MYSLHPFSVPLDLSSISILSLTLLLELSHPLSLKLLSDSKCLTLILSLKLSNSHSYFHPFSYSDSYSHSPPLSISSPFSLPSPPLFSSLLLPEIGHTKRPRKPSWIFQGARPPSKGVLRDEATAVPRPAQQHLSGFEHGLISLRFRQALHSSANWLCAIKSCALACTVRAWSRGFRAVIEKEKVFCLSRVLYSNYRSW